MGTFAPTRSFWFDVNSEDIDIVERGQRGLTFGSFPPGTDSSYSRTPTLVSK